MGVRKTKKNLSMKMVNGAWKEIDITFDTRFYLHKITVNIGRAPKNGSSKKIN